MGGRPGLAFQRQNSRQPARCQRSNVSGRTTTRASRQSNSRERNASDTRVTASTRLGFTPRSVYSASSRRRKRFSASMDRRGLTESAIRPTKSASNRRKIRTKTITLQSCHSWAMAAPRGQSERDRVFAEHNVIEQRLYQLIRQPKPIADRQFEIEFLDPGVEAFVFTFG
jgi:hypothetical protein